jgi:hypothetical protein
MHGTMSAIEAGEVDARVGVRVADLAGEDELAELAAHFDRLLDRLAEQTDALQRWGRELDSKVARAHPGAGAGQRNPALGATPPGDVGEAGGNRPTGRRRGP